MPNKSDIQPALPESPVPDKYNLKRIVTRDGHSVLYEAVNRGTKRTVLLRTWQDHPSQDANNLAQLVRAVVAAKSEHLVQILDMELPSDPDAAPVLVLERVKGDPLADQIKKEPLPVGRACRVTFELAEVCRLCHEWGIIPLGPTVETVFLANFSGRRHFLKVLAPNGMARSPDEDARSEDAVACANILWKSLTGDEPAQDLTLEQAAEGLQHIEGIQGQALFALADVISKGLAGTWSVTDLAEGLQATGLIEAPSVEESISFESLPERLAAHAQATAPEIAKQPKDEGVLPAHAKHPGKLAVRLTAAAFLGFALGVATTMAAQRIWMSRGARSQPPKAAVSKTTAPVTSNPQQRPAKHVVVPSHALKFAIGYYSPSALVRKEMVHLTKYLSQKLHRPVVIVEASASRVAQGLEEGTLQIAVFSPYLYVLNRAKHPDIRLIASHLADGSLSYEGYLVVRDESPIRTLEQTKGKRICFVSPRSTSGYLFPAALLMTHGIIPHKDFSMVRYSGSHRAVIDDLMAHRCDVGAVGSPGYYNAIKRAHFTLRIVAVTDRIPGDAYCISPKLSSSLASAIKQAFIQFSPRKDLHRKYLPGLHRITGFRIVTDAHYDPIRKVQRIVYKNLPGQERTEVPSTTTKPRPHHNDRPRGARHGRRIRRPTQRRHAHD